MARPTDFDAMDSTRGSTLTVHVRVRNLWRLRLGLMVIRAGASILGANLASADWEPPPGSPGPEVLPTGWER